MTDDRTTSTALMDITNDLSATSWMFPFLRPYVEELRRRSAETRKMELALDLIVAEAQEDAEIVERSCNVVPIGDVVRRVVARAIKIRNEADV